MGAHLARLGGTAAARRQHGMQSTGLQASLALHAQGLKDLSTLCYAWRAEGDLAWEDGDRFYPGAAHFPCGLLAAQVLCTARA